MAAWLRAPLAAVLLLAAAPARSQILPGGQEDASRPGPDLPPQSPPQPAPEILSPEAPPVPSETLPETDTEPRPVPREPPGPPARPPRSLAEEPFRPSALSGIERAGRRPGDRLRAIASGLLYLPRKAVDLIFLATGTAAGLVHDEQVVPRIADIVSPDEGEIGVFPTAFMETGQLRFSIGARAIANLGDIATGLRAGYGGPDELVTETRIRFSRRTGIPATLSLEALHDRRTDLGYRGVGQVPEQDPRNRFVFAATTKQGLYRERRVRGIASLGLRPASDVEIFLSASFTRRLVDDPPDAEERAMSRVFMPGSVPGAGAETRYVYGEVAARTDTRPYRARPSPGVLFELYAGSAAGDDTQHDELSWLARVGGRLAAFLPIVRQTTILSPKLVLDSVLVLDGALPFTELPRQPEFRGLDERRDQVSLVGSIDYRWAVARYVDARLFFDAATVGPEPKDLDFRHIRVAGGIGADLASASAEIGRVALSVSPEGARIMLSIGGSTRFGDRQHRD